MKRLLSFVIAILFFILPPTRATAATLDNHEAITESFSTINDDGSVVRTEISRYSEYVTTRVYVNDVLTQESTGSLSSDTITTKIYDTDGQIASTSDMSISSITSTVNIPVTDNISSVTPELGTNAFVPVDPGMGGGDGNDDNGTLPQRDIMNEPVDNSGLVYTHTDDDLDYYYLGESTAFDVTGQLYRAYVYRYIGDTHYFTWGSGTVSSVITTAFCIVFPMPALAYAATIAITYGTEYLFYDTSVEIATYEHDYYYQVHVDGDCIFEPCRYKTYWHIDNITTGKTTYQLKSDDGGSVLSNIDMIHHAVLNYY